MVAYVCMYVCIMYFKIHVSGKLCSDLGSRVGCGPQWELTDVFWEKTVIETSKLIQGHHRVVFAEGGRQG